MASEGVVVKLLVDKARNQVLFAESDGDFVDILFSFLTIPLAQLVKLLDKKSSIGCMDQLYESVEKINPCDFMTENCKSILISPRSTSELQFLDLAVKYMHGFSALSFYTCTCRSNSYETLSMYAGTRCHCGQMTDREILLEEPEATTDGAFVKRTARFLITDSLQVIPSSMMTSFKLLNLAGICDGGDTEQKIVVLGVKEILTLLKYSLVSKTPLTNTFLLHEEKLGNYYPACSNFAAACLSDVKIEGESSRSSSKMLDLKLLISISKNKVLCAEAGNQFLNLLFSFLTCPLGAVVEQLGGCCSLGCIDELYASVQSLGVGQYVKSEACKLKLVSPKVPPYFSCDTRYIKLTEESWSFYRCLCSNCWFCKRAITNRITCITTSKITDSDCSNCKRTDADSFEMKLKNPRGYDCESNREFLKAPAMFMVTDELSIVPSSPMKGFELVNNLNVPFSDVVERVVTLGKPEVMDLLKSCLTSKSCLSQVFLQKTKVKSEI